MVRTYLIAAAAPFLLGSVAQAADLPRRSAPPPVAPAYAPPVFTWTGFYVGLNAGVAIRENQWGGGFGGWAPGTDNRTGFTGGGQIGYNWQMSGFVLGLETDLNYVAGKNVSNVWWLGNVTSSDGLLGTVRGRAGFALDRMLIYATGGFAYGRAFNQAWYPVAGTPLFASQTTGGMKIGYTIGGGVEYAFTDAWSAKVEYLFADIRRDNNAWGATVWTRPAQNHIVRAGVNYHFNWGGAGPAVARY